MLSAGDGARGGAVGGHDRGRLPAPRRAGHDDDRPGGRNRTHLQPDDRPPAAARSFTRRPYVAITLSVAIALVVVWAAIALSYQTNWPVGVFVGTASATAYALGRLWRFAQRVKS